MAETAVVQPNLSVNQLQNSSDFHSIDTDKIQKLAKERIPSSSVDSEKNFEVQHLPTEIKKLHQNTNFMNRLRNLVNKLIEQFQRVSENRSRQMEEMKSKYGISNHEAASLMRKLGNAGLWISAAALGVMLTKFMPIPGMEEADKEIIDFIAKQVPQAAGIFTAGYQGRQREAEAVASLMLAEYNAKSSQSQQDSQTKETYNQLFREVLDLLKRASSSQ